MREPPLGLDDVPHPALEVVFDEILAAPTTEELLTGIYAVALPALNAALAKYAADTNPLTDAPSRRVIRFARLELADMTAYGQQAVAAFGATDRTHLDALLTQAGTLDGTAPVSDDPPTRVRSVTPYRYDPVPQRDDRFEDLWNQGVNPEAFLYDAAFPARAKVLMMLYKRLREIDVPEVMAGVLAGTPGKPVGVLPWP